MTKAAMTPKDLSALVTRALLASRINAANAGSVARALVEAEIDGQVGHGVSRVLSYAAQSRSGKVDGYAVPRLVQTRPGTVMIDAAHGFAYPALDLAIDVLPSRASVNGIAAAGLFRSHHAGVVGRHVERLAERGFLALIVSNTPQAMASTGGRRPVFGTNPIGFAAPRPGAPPIVVDMALSTAARGKIVTAAQKGEPIPEGWAVDDAGHPTTDAKAALKGTLLPLGGAKGAALALMVEVLAAALTGAAFASEATSFLDAEGLPPSVGQTIIVIDPAAFAGRDLFLARISALAEMICSDPGARLPGSRRLQLRDAVSRHGVRVEADIVAQIQKLGDQLGDP
jgi:(2R)-3-sulfolactate dehydrogenase (NADP+)